MFHCVKWKKRKKYFQKCFKNLFKIIPSIYIFFHNNETNIASSIFVASWERVIALLNNEFCLEGNISSQVCFASVTFVPGYILSQVMLCLRWNFVKPVDLFSQMTFSLRGRFVKMMFCPVTFLSTFIQMTFCLCTLISV